MAPDAGGSRQWSASTEGQARQDLVIARFPLEEGDGRFIEFGWRGENDDVSAQCDILLQLVVDSVESALQRLRQTSVAVESAIVASAVVESEAVESAVAERTPRAGTKRPSVAPPLLASS